MDCVTLPPLLQMELTKVKASTLKVLMCFLKLALNENSYIKNQCLSFFSV